MLTSTPLNQATRYALRATVVVTVVEDGAVLLDLGSKYFFRLNETAWLITQLFETGGSTDEEIVEQCRRWGAPENDPSVTALLVSFRREGLIEEAPKRQVAVPQFSGPWSPPTIERQAEPLQGLVTSAFDPTFPLAE